MGDKNTIVYCARVATRRKWSERFGCIDEKPVVCFVSKAKLYAEKTRELNGEVIREGAIEFEHIYKDHFGKIEGCDEEEGKLFIKRVFDDYQSCREYVDKQNEYFLKSKNIGGISLRARFEHDRDVADARALEDKYITEQERQQVIENINNY